MTSGWAVPVRLRTSTPNERSAVAHRFRPARSCRLIAFDSGRNSEHRPFAVGAFLGLWARASEFVTGRWRRWKGTRPEARLPLSRAADSV